MFTRSPFPGMDLWLQRGWDSLQPRLLLALCDVLRGRLPPGLFADVEQMADEPNRHRRVSVRRFGPGGPRVAAIEVLTREDKADRAGAGAYAARQAADLAAGVSTLTLDLIRGGRRMLATPIDAVPVKAVTPYKAWCRPCGPAGAERTMYYWPLSLRDRLPLLPVPLGADEPHVPLDLQQAVDRVYATGQYGATLDYAATLDPPLSAADAAWAAGRVAAARRETPNGGG